MTTSGWYRLRTSAIYGDVYRIDAGFADGEYLLIENRQAVYYDKNIPSTGLVIWHIDEDVDGGWQSRPGWPGQEGWPYNGNHYHVSILQADGLYELEKGMNNGGAGDLFAGPGVGLFPGGPYPNSDGYSGGFTFQSGVTISDISESSDDMTFWFSIPADSTPTSPPNLRATQNPTAHPITSSILPTLSPPTNVPTPHHIPEPTLWSTLEEPTLFPTVNPTDMHTSNPTRRPTRTPFPAPTPYPSTPIMVVPVADHPTRRPTFPRFPTVFPSPTPSDRPHFPTIVPSPSPSDRPVVTPGPVDFAAFVPLANSPPAVPTRRSNRVRPTRATMDLAEKGVSRYGH